jgi:hypothetical protein
MHTTTRTVSLLLLITLRPLHSAALLRLRVSRCCSITTARPSWIYGCSQATSSSTSRLLARRPAVGTAFLRRPRTRASPPYAANEAHTGKDGGWAATGPTGPVAATRANRCGQGGPGYVRGRLRGSQGTGGLRAIQSQRQPQVTGETAWGLGRMITNSASDAQLKSSGGVWIYG